MKVIFLDFDGVLAPYSSRYEAGKFSFGPVENLNKILKAVTEAKIVVSSSWRRHGLEYVKDMLEKNGVSSGRVTGITPETENGREHHIKAYLDEHKDITNYVILDDERLDMPDQHFVKVNQHVGLTETEAKRAIEILK